MRRRVANLVPVREHRIEAAGYEAHMTSAGATLRRLTYEGDDLIVPFEAGEGRPAMRGALLAPWPNRTDGGRYRFGGEVHQLKINEPERRNASHGFAADAEFTLMSATPDTVVLGAQLGPVEGYPWRLDVRVTASVSEAGLSHRVVVANLSATDAPVGIGVHPYVLAGGAAPHVVDGWSLEIPADEVMLVTPDRLLPDGVVAVSEPACRELDFREPRAVGETMLNHGFTALRRDSDGRARARVRDPRGRGVEIAVDEAYRWLQVYSSDEVDDGCPRTGLAIEPMTCPPDALNSTLDLLVLDPEASTSATFWLRRIERD